MEVFRGRLRKSFAAPAPLTPNKPEEFLIGRTILNTGLKKDTAFILRHSIPLILSYP
jgi:hypothetical protein